MNFTALLIGLGPVIGWGFYPTISAKLGGRPANQILGSTLGTLIFALIFNLVTGTSLPTGMDLFLSIISGMSWAIAQSITFQSFTLIGSSRAMPITTAFQLIANALWGVIALGNWPGVAAKLLGTLALVLIIIGASMTVWSEDKRSQQNANNLKKAVMLLAVGAIGYWGYSAAPQASSISGMQAFLPQAIGMVIGALGYVLLVNFKDNEPLALTEVLSYKHILPGFFFAFAALTYLISAQPNMNGLATGFILSQTSVVLATLTGIWFLGEEKTKKEMLVTIAGLVLIIAAAGITVVL
ncbi:MAG: GRP family sugar transporter [Aerococcus sp.]|nr:GRP family sugar transporter [Aerococcus sp.]